MSPKKSQFTEEELFRDSISTIDESGKRKWIYPKKPKGIFYKYRTYVSFVLLLFLFGMPFVKVGGQPILLFNILERKFIIFGLTFMPQDFHLFVLAMLTFVVFIVLFTVIYGRIFCGWACPQTIFMEMVFRKIEYWIDGDAAQQKKLAKAPWSLSKIRKRVSKHSIFYAISFLIGNTFLAYIIGVDELYKIVTGPFSENVGGFAKMIGFSTVFYLVFAYLREQVCLVACPYGRLQGVLLDQDSIVVHYDFVRGEPREKLGKRKNKAKPTTDPALQTSQSTSDVLVLADGEASLAEAANNNEGDCIDCGMCVRVCPTGIDIRNGIQLECINCTACIDACDAIMEKVNKPKGLIRYDSYNGIANQQKFRFTPRIIAYSVVLVGLIAVLGFSLISRSDFETTILRTPGMLYQEKDENTLSNLYNVQIANKTTQEIPVRFKVESPEGASIRTVGDDIVLTKQGIAKGVFFVDMPKELVQGQKTRVKIGVYSNGKLIDKVSTNFLGPIQ